MTQLDRHVSFMQHLKKICGLYKPKYAVEICEITELYILWSELSQHKLSPTLASVPTTLALTALLG